MPEFAAELGQRLVELAEQLGRFLLALAFLAAVFWASRRFATRLNRLQRKQALYAVSCGSFVVLLVANKHLPDVIVTGGLLAAIVSFFAILAAPKW
jgi:predicted membrane protein